MHKKLYLASHSHSRKLLLQEAHIPFEVVGHSADESICDWTLPLAYCTEYIAIQKMNHALLPQAPEGDECFVISADTLTADQTGTVFGKPGNKSEARDMIVKLRDGALIATGYCVDHQRVVNGQWKTMDRVAGVVEAEWFGDMPDAWIDRYLDSFDATAIAGALMMEGYGALFTRRIVGSYSAIMGLPMVEIRKALQAIDYF